LGWRIVPDVGKIEVPRYDREPILLGVNSNVSVSRGSHPNVTNIHSFMIVTLEQLRRGTRHVGVDEKPHS
jgi:hypothetical protein